jgi:hypothetical protein
MIVSLTIHTPRQTLILEDDLDAKFEDNELDVVLDQLSRYTIERREKRFMHYQPEVLNLEGFTGKIIGGKK